MIEPKLLLGGEIDQGLHWGLNLIYEREVNINSRDRAVEYALTGGLSKTITDERFSIGLEARYVNEVVHKESANELYLGPSLQFRPHKKAMIDFVPMWGTTPDSRNMDIWTVFKWNF